MTLAFSGPFSLLKCFGLVENQTFSRQLSVKNESNLCQIFEIQLPVMRSVEYLSLFIIWIMVRQPKWHNSCLTLLERWRKCVWLLRCMGQCWLIN